MSDHKLHMEHIITQNFPIVIKNRQGKSRIISVPSKSGIFIMLFRQVFPESLIFRNLDHLWNSLCGISFCLYFH